MDRLLDGLTEAQRVAVTSPASPLCILAGAGSGKTRVLTRRIAYQAEEGAVDPSRTLTLTFTRKAAGELRLRLRQLGLSETGEAGTFHAVAFAQLRSRWADNNITPPRLLERKGQILGRLLPRQLDRAGRAAVASELDWAAARRVDAASYPGAATLARRNPPIPPEQVAALMTRYQEEKRRQRAIDFDDLLLLALRDMADPDYAATRHWRHRHLFVDEFQDVNPLQFALLSAWSGPQASLCVVGDPNQAIYAWNGADASYLERFGHWFPGGETLQLKENFRSTPQILAAAAGVLGQASRLVATRPPGPKPTVVACADERSEARSVARRVRDRHRPGGPWRAQAVLVRTNAQTALLAEALRAASIPVVVRGGAGLLDDPVAQDRLDELQRRPVALAGALTDLRMDAGAAEDPARADILNALAALAEDHLHQLPGATSADFVEWARAALRAEEGGPDRDAVEVTTFHASKGLEWPIVHLAGLEDGLVPIGRASTAAEQAEERRLFAVACTRAADELHLTWCRTRRFGPRSVERTRSPLLEDALEGLGLATAPAERPSRRDGAARAKGVRRSLRNGEATRSTADDDPLLIALKRWRTSAAKAADVPAYVVFPDATLVAIADRKPRTPNQLAAVPGIGPVKLARYGEVVLDLVSSADGPSPDPT